MAAHSRMMVDMLLSFKTYQWLPSLAIEARIARALQARVGGEARGLQGRDEQQAAARGLEEERAICRYRLQKKGCIRVMQ